jgi:hypothetical protein
MYLQGPDEMTEGSAIGGKVVLITAEVYGSKCGGVYRWNADD